MARLLEHDSALQKFDTFHFKGHWLRNGDMMNAICDVADISRKRILPFPWWAINATAPFVELSDEMQEIRYLWNEPIELDNGKLRAQIGDEPHTPLDAAIRTTLTGMKCLASSNCTAAPASSY
jgi:nucleoside-diphosphate-sugar epimerase